MPGRKIRPVTDGFDKKVTYKTQFERYDKAVKTAFISRLCLLFMLLLRTDSGRGFSISDVLIPDSQQDLTIKEAKTN